VPTPETSPEASAALGQQRATEAGKSIGLNGQLPSAEDINTSGVAYHAGQIINGPDWMNVRPKVSDEPNPITKATGYTPPAYTPPPDPVTGAPGTLDTEITRRIGEWSPLGLAAKAVTKAPDLPSLDWGDVGDAIQGELGYGGYVGDESAKRYATMTPKEKTDLVVGMLAGGDLSIPHGPGGVEIGLGEGARPIEDFLGGGRGPDVTPEDIPVPTTKSAPPARPEDISLARSTGRQVGGVTEQPTGARQADQTLLPDTTGFFRRTTPEVSARESTRVEPGEVPGPPVPERAGAKPTETGRKGTDSGQPSGADAAPVEPAAAPKTGRFRIWGGETPAAKPEITTGGGNDVLPSGLTEAEMQAWRDSGGQTVPGTRAAPVEGPAEPAPRTKTGTLDDVINGLLERTDSRKAMTENQKALEAKRQAELLYQQENLGKAQDAWFASSEEAGGTTRPKSGNGGVDPARVGDATKPVIDKSANVKDRVPDTGGDTAQTKVKTRAAELQDVLTGTKPKDTGNVTPAGAEPGTEASPVEGPQRPPTVKTRAAELEEVLTGAKPKDTGTTTPAGAEPGPEAAPVEGPKLSPQRKSVLDDAIAREVDTVSAQRAKPLSEAEKERAIQIASERIQGWFGKDADYGGRPTTEMGPSKAGQPRKGLSEPGGTRSGEPFTKSRDYQPPPGEPFTKSRTYEAAPPKEGEPFTKSRTYQEAPPKEGEPFYASRTYQEAPPKEGEPFTATRDYQAAPKDPYSRVPEEMRAPATGQPVKPRYEMRTDPETGELTVEEVGPNPLRPDYTTIAEEAGVDAAGNPIVETKAPTRKFPSKKALIAAAGGAAFGAAVVKNRMGSTDPGDYAAMGRADLANMSQPGTYSTYMQGRRKGMPSDAFLVDATTATGVPGYEGVQVYVDPRTKMPTGFVNEFGDYETPSDLSDPAEQKAIADRIQANGGSSQYSGATMDVTGTNAAGEDVTWNTTVGGQRAAGRPYDPVEEPISPPVDAGTVAPNATGAGAAGEPSAGGTPIVSGDAIETGSGGSGSGWHTYGSRSSYGGSSRYSGKRKKKKGGSYGSSGSGGGFWPGFPFNRPNSPIRQHVLDAIAASLAKGDYKKGR
jgi:hypothetical protein